MMERLINAGIAGVLGAMGVLSMAVSLSLAVISILGAWKLVQMGLGKRGK